MSERNVPLSGDNFVSHLTPRAPEEPKRRAQRETPTMNLEQFRAMGEELERTGQDLDRSHPPDSRA